VPDRRSWRNRHSIVFMGEKRRKWRGWIA